MNRRVEPRDVGYVPWVYGDSGRRTEDSRSLFVCVWIQVASCPVYLELCLQKAAE